MPAEPLARLLLHFDRDADDPDRLRAHLSACALDGDGRLWLGSDERNGLSRLQPTAPGVLARHRWTDLADRLQLLEQKEEVDLEGLDIDGDRLWLVGSHTSTRKDAQPERAPAENLARLTRVEPRPNRLLIACARMDGGRLAEEPITRLPIDGAGNALTRALGDDPHLGSFVGDADGGSIRLASKENGLDIEGLAARGDDLWLGLRGPVLRGWALLLTVRATATADGALDLAPIGTGGRPYRKQFLRLAGMGLRDLCWHGEDLLLLTGPTMDIAGPQAVWRLHNPAELPDDSLIEPDGARLELLFHLPLVTDGDKAEGLCRYDGAGAPGLLVVYDAPRRERLIGPDAVLADVFPLAGG